MIAPDLVELGVAFYDSQCHHGATDRMARHATVCYMRRKDADMGDAMPYYEALADALALRASRRLASAHLQIVQDGRTIQQIQADE